MKDRPSTMKTDGPAKAQPARLLERQIRRLASRAMVASSMVVAISPPPAHMGLRARRERGWDTAAVREPSSSRLLSFSLGCADIRTHSCALQGCFWSFVALPERSGRWVRLAARLPRPALSPGPFGLLAPRWIPADHRYPRR